jgi:hypothetical protein
MPVAASNLKAGQFVKWYTLNKGSGEHLDHAPYINRPDNDVLALLAHALTSADRFLLVFVAIELISMPVTQYVWTWDHFLHGGMDFESNLLFLVVCLGLLLVLRNHCRQDKNLRASMWRLSLSIFDTGKSAAAPGAGILLPFHRKRRTCSGLASCNLPLQT